MINPAVDSFFNASLTVGCETQNILANSFSAGSLYPEVYSPVIMAELICSAILTGIVVISIGQIVILNPIKWPVNVLQSGHKMSNSDICR